jgi:bifunctional non-homologous end joining protein LigD
VSLPRPRPRTLPLVEPIVPVLRAEPFDDPAYLFEPKYDGFRGLVHLTRDSCLIRSKRGFFLTRFGELEPKLREHLLAWEAILDGEIVSLDQTGRPMFHDLFAARGPVAYVAFDLLWVDGRDLRGLPLEERKARLERVLPEDTNDLLKVLTVEAHGRHLFDAAQRLDLEGIVAKRKADPYASETVWYKVKNRACTQAEGRSELFRGRGR